VLLDLKYWDFQLLNYIVRHRKPQSDLSILLIETLEKLLLREPRQISTFFEILPLYLSVYQEKPSISFARRLLQNVVSYELQRKKSIYK
jgi:hypothetical protein